MNDIFANDNKMFALQQDDSTDVNTTVGFYTFYL